MSGLGGLNKSPQGVVIGLVQLQLPVVETPKQLAEQTQKIVSMVGKARRNLAGMDIVVFPEYALHGLSMDTNPEIMCSMDGPEVAAFKQACIDNDIWGCFSIMEFKGISKKSVDLCACANNVQNKANTEGNDESFSKCLTMCCALLARALRGVKNELMALLKILNLAR